MGGGGGGGTNVSCQLKFWPFVSCQLKGNGNELRMCELSIEA